MTKLTPAEGRPLVPLDALPQRSAEEGLEELARALMTVAGLLDSAELRSELCPVDMIERARRTLERGVQAQTALRSACEPATVAELCECIASLIQSIPQGDAAPCYSAALTTDVGSLQPSRGALAAACRRLRTTAMFRPKIPEVLNAVHEACLVYETALRAVSELSTQIAKAEQRLRADGKRQPPARNWTAREQADAETQAYRRSCCCSAGK